MLSEELFSKVTLMLWSELEGRVPLGALSAFFEQAGRNYLVEQGGDSVE
jgi:hypothetical protein